MTTSRTIRKFLVAVAVLALMNVGAAQSCLRPVTVTSTALGAAHTVEEQALADAVTAALNQAITQARGVYVTSRQELWSEFRDGTFREQLVDEISSRFSGFVPSYRILDQAPAPNGGIQVTVEATVCLDDRIAFTLGDDVFQDAVVASLAGEVAAAGWRLVVDAPTTGASDAELLEFAMANGITYLAQGSSSTTFGVAHGFESAQVTIALNLFDVRTFEVAHSFAVTVTGVGSTREAALQDAATRVANEIGRDWNREFLANQDRNATEFVFTGVRRSGTRFSLEDIAAQLAGVLEVRSSAYDSHRGEVRLELQLSSDPCLIAREFSAYRRVLTELRSCTPERAHFHVYND